MQSNFLLLKEKDKRTGLPGLLVGDRVKLKRAAKAAL